MVGVLTFIFGLDLGFGRRGFCHYGCWMAPFNIIGTRIGDMLKLRRFKLKADPDRCIGCGACTRNCPMGLDVQKMVAKGDMMNDECVMCLTCVDGCPKKAISV
jgi:polyferredoxin